MWLSFSLGCFRWSQDYGGGEWGSEEKVEAVGDGMEKRYGRAHRPTLEGVGKG